MSNSILPAAGNLDIVNANVRADKFNAATNIGVANTNPDFNFSVGDKFHVDKDSTDPVSITGNVVASGIKISNLTIGPAFDFASVSNVGNVTANVIQFANATTGFTTTANVEIGGNISLTSNAQVKVGSNVLAEYTGPHGREPKEMPLKKFPEIVFDASKYDQNHSTNTYIQAGYTVTASSQATDAKNAANLYNEQFPTLINTDDGWQSRNNTYDGSTGVAASIDTLTGITGATSSRNGSYTTLELPHKIKLSYLQIHTRNSVDHGTPVHPKQVYVYGSNDGSSWTQVGSHLFTSVPSSPIWQRIDINSTTPYKYFVLQTTSILPYLDSSLNRVYILDLEWYGYEEPAPPGDLSLDTTLKSTFNSVRSNNYVMYFDGKDPNGTDPKNLVSGSSISLTNNNATYDASNDYWTLDGSTESNVTTGSLGFEGDVPHTVSMWVNSSNLDANALTQQLFSIGSGYDKALVRVDDTQIAANTWHNVTYAYQGEGGSKVTYVDGRKVEEARVEDTFGEYPPFAMTGYSQGGYVVSASSEYPGGYNSWEAFDDLTGANDYWSGSSSIYSLSSPFNFTGTASIYKTTVSGVLYTGEWIQIEMPNKLVLNYTDLKTGGTATDRFPRQGVFAGSNDGVNWDAIHIFSGLNGGTTETSIVTNSENNTRGYKYIRIIITHLNGNGFVGIATLKLYGHKEGDLTRFPEPTRVLKYPHVVMTGPGQRGYVASSSTIEDALYAPWKVFNGNSNTGTGNGSDSWISKSDAFTSGTSNSNYGFDFGSGQVNGPWLRLDLPHKLKMDHVDVYRRDGGGYDQYPKSGYIYGYDGSTWHLLKTFTNITQPSVLNATTIPIDSNIPVSSIVMLITERYDGTTTTNQFVIIKQLEYYGTQENTETPMIVGGPFAGKVANFRVYDQYLGDERIQEIYDAQKDEFGHKKSSMTFYKGRIGVGTTEPEGALTVVDEPHALAKFPARAVSADESYVEGDGQIKLSAADGSGYQAFDGLTSTSWTATPERHTRLSEEVDFGAWLKIQTPESVSLKKAEIESNPYWRQVGSEILTTNASEYLGRAVACSHDGTRIIAGGHAYNNFQGLARVYDWNGTTWENTTNTLIGTATGDNFGIYVAMSGDGSTIAVAARNEHVEGVADKGTVRVYYLSGSTWTVLPDSGPFTESGTGVVDTFVGQTSEAEMGGGGIHLSYDGRTLLITEPKSDSAGTDRGETRIFTYADGAWSQKGISINGTVNSEELGSGSDMTEDGNHIVIGTKGNAANPRVQVYEWNGTNAWQQKGSDLTYSGSDEFGPVVSISNDGNTVAVGIARADIADGALVDNGGLVHVYHWTGSAWGTPHKLTYNEAVDEYFGTIVVLSGDGKRLLVGAPGESTFSGEILTYAYTGDSWKLRKAGVVGLVDTGNYQYTGYGPGVQDSDSVALSRDGSTIVSGGFGHDSPLSNSGRVRVFSMPSNIKSIWGSNDDVNWTKITTAPTREEATSNVAGLAFGYDDRLEFKNLDNPNYYKYHAIVADAFTRLKDVKLFGVRKQGSSTLHDGTLTLTKNLDVPRIGPPPDADDTPRRDRLVVEYNTSTNPLEDGVVRDTSGRGNDGAFYGGASYDASAKALVFDGTNDNLKTTLNSPEMRTLSISGWIKNIDDNTLLELDGGAATSKHVKINVVSGSAPGTGLFIALADGTYLFANNSLSPNTWNHFVFVLNSGPAGSTLSSINHQLYINGVIEFGRGGNAFNAGATANDTTVIDPNATLCIGSTEAGSGYHDGSISNFKLYDTALTAQEVKTLYDMGRCDEGHHVVNFSKTRVGIGLGDGEFPRGALDVRGDINVQGTITTFTHPYGPSYSLTTISPDIWAIAGESTARIGGGAISYTSGVSIKYHNGVPMWFFGGIDENVDILNTISHTTNTWSIAIAIAKKPESFGALFNQITNSESDTSTNHRVTWSGNFGGDEYPPSGNGWNTSPATTAIPDESVVFVKKEGTGSSQMFVYVNGGLIGQSTSAETYTGSAPDKIRLGRRTRYSGYVAETPIYMGIAAIAVWDSAIDNADIAKYITYQSLTAR
jgi:hypothetical protein